MSAALRAFWSQFNIFISDFGHISSFLKCKLFKQYCTSYYGSPLWSLDSKKLMDIGVAWRKALKVIWRLPNMTHRNILACISDSLPLELQIEKRFINFFTNVVNHDTDIVKTAARLSMHNPWSVCGRNVT